MPLDRLLIETDSPYLTPVPFRGRRNEPGRVINTAACLAELRGVSLEELARLTWENGCRAYGLPADSWPGPLETAAIAEAREAARQEKAKQGSPMDEPSRMPEKGRKPAGEPEELPLISEVIVVEGKGRRSGGEAGLPGELLTTSGLGLSRKRLEEIRRARERRA